MDDVPLICDPVPGPGVILSVSHVLSPEAVVRIRQSWEAEFVGMPRPIAIEKVQVKLLIRQRTEWPDAEFCAA